MRDGDWCRGAREGTEGPADPRNSQAVPRTVSSRLVLSGSNSLSNTFAPCVTLPPPSSLTVDVDLDHQLSRLEQLLDWLLGGRLTP